MSETAARREIVAAWAPYIAIIVTIVVTVGGAAWSIGAGQAQLGAKIEAVEAKVSPTQTRSALCSMPSKQTVRRSPPTAQRSSVWLDG